MVIRTLSLMVALAIPGTGFAQVLMQRTAVGSCQAAGPGDEIEFTGSSYLFPSGSQSTLFHCPIDAALAAPGAITSATVWVGDHSTVEDATAQICYTNLDASPNEVCGPLVSSAGSGYFAQALEPVPPGGLYTRSHAAFLKVYIPAPNVPGYGFFRGFRVE